MDAVYYDYRLAVVMALMPMLPLEKPSNPRFSFARYLDQEHFPGIIITMALLLTHPVGHHEFSREICYEGEGVFLIRTRSGQAITLGMDEVHAKCLYEEAQAMFNSALWMCNNLTKQCLKTNGEPKPPKAQICRHHPITDPSASLSLGSGRRIILKEFPSPIRLAISGINRATWSARCLAVVFIEMISCWTSAG